MTQPVQPSQPPSTPLLTYPTDDWDDELDNVVWDFVERRGPVEAVTIARSLTPSRYRKYVNTAKAREICDSYVEAGTMLLSEGYYTVTPDLPD